MGGGCLKLNSTPPPPPRSRNVSESVGFLDKPVLFLFFVFRENVKG